MTKTAEMSKLDKAVEKALGTLAFVTQKPSFTTPSPILWRQFGRHEFLLGPDFSAVYMLNPQDLTVIEKVWGKNQPIGLAGFPDGKLLAFTDFLDMNLELYRIE